MSAQDDSPAIAPMSRRRFLTAAAATAALAATGAAVRGAYRFEVTRERAVLEGLAAPLRLAFLCDLHFGPYIGVGSVAAWVDRARSLDADLIALGGDLVDRLAGDTAPLVRELARLRAPLGVVAVWGNHDHNRFRDLEGFRRDLGAAGIDVLVNEGIAVRSDLYIAAIDDLRGGRPDLGAALQRRPRRGACLLLSHNPDVLPQVPQDVDLTLCGHTHGGQVCLPGVGPVLTSSRHGRRFAQGWVRGPARGYVSRGLGVGWLPVRVACPAELTLLDLAPANVS
jgi:uncharacterized protein